MQPIVSYRAFQADDLEVLRQIMVDAFDGVSIDHGIEQVHGLINERDWQWRKGRHLDEDISRDPEGVIVAECDGSVIGFISTSLDPDAGIGHIAVFRRPADDYEQAGRDPGCERWRLPDDSKTMAEHAAWDLR